MNLYEFISISDAITFYAPDDDIAFAVTLYVGSGQVMCQRCLGDGNVEVKDSQMYLFEVPDEVLKKFDDIIRNRSREVMEAAHTFACCKPRERRIFDEFTKNGTDKKKYAKWDDAHRTSLNDYCKYARSIRLKSEDEKKKEKGKES